jgi:hypothetical protein
VEVDRFAVSSSSPASGRCTPASILTIVDLPAPFSPTRACASSRLPSWAYGNSGTRFKVFAQPGVPRTPRRRSPTPPVHQVHRRRADRRAAHPVGPGRRLRGAAATPRSRASARRDQLQRLPGRRLQARLGHQPRPGGPPQGHRPPARVRRHHGRDRLARPEALVLRRHQLPRPGRHARPPGPARRGAARVYDRLGDDQRMLLEYKLFEPAFYTTDVPDWGTPYAHCLELGPKARSASTPATTPRAPTSSSSSRSCCGPGSSARSTSTAASTPTTT